jgi:hypothetical protein
VSTVVRIVRVSRPVSVLNASRQVNVLSHAAAHAASHLRAGTDEIDGDQLDIDWNPSNYTPTTVAEADHADHLAAHLKGIDTAIGTANTALDGKVPKADYTAKGRILVGTGSGSYTALAVGSNDQVLTADSNEASGVKWADTGAASGQAELIATTTTLSSGGLQLLGLDLSAYREVQIVWYGVTVDTDATPVELRFSTGGSVTSSNSYVFTQVMLTSASSSTESVTSAAAAPGDSLRLYGGASWRWGIGTGRAGNGQITIHDPSSITLYRAYRFDFLFIGTGGNSVHSRGGGHFADTASAIDGVRMQVDSSVSGSATITAGRLSLYGVRA